METVNDLYIRSLALYDEISKSGEINASKTADYKARTPHLADALQRELWDTSDYTKIFEFEYLLANKLLKTNLPADFKTVKKIVLTSDDDNYIVYNGYEIEKDGIEHYLYMRADKECTARVQYKPYPVTITNIDDNIQLDPITSLGIAYGLCRYFAMSEQNEFVEGICNAKFNEIKNKRVRVPASIESITDIYRAGD